MRDLRPAPNDPSGHDHFFATFGKFEAAADDDGAMLARSINLLWGVDYHRMHDLHDEALGDLAVAYVAPA